MFMLMWRDCIEILFFIGLVYKIALFLQRDTQRNLVGYFYGYCGVLVVTWYAQLNALYALLLFGAPVVALLFIIFHQEQLQKNYITLKLVGQNLSTVNKDWHDRVIRGFLYALNRNKMMACVFERKDALCLQTDQLLDALISYDLLALIIDCATYNQTQFIWIDAGRVMGFNAKPLWNEEHLIFDSQVQQCDAWIQQALLMTRRTDALVMGIDIKSRTFTLIAEGKVVEKINSETALRLLRKYYNNHEAPKKDEYEYTFAQRGTSGQLHH